MKFFYVLGTCQNAEPSRSYVQYKNEESALNYNSEINDLWVIISIILIYLQIYIKEKKIKNKKIKNHYINIKLHVSPPNELNKMHLFFFFT